MHSKLTHIIFVKNIMWIKNIMGIKKNPIAAGVIGLVFGTVLGVLIDRYINKCDCGKEIFPAAADYSNQDPVGLVGYYKKIIIDELPKYNEYCDKKDTKSASASGKKILDAYNEIEKIKSYVDNGNFKESFYGKDVFDEEVPKFPDNFKTTIENNTNINAQDLLWEDV